MDSKIYTKTGDKGETSLIGGTRVPKYHDRIEAYGTVDELISYIGLIRDQKIDDKTILVLIEIQDRLMTCASILATDCENCKVKIPEIYDSDIETLEKEIDKMDKDLPPLRSFILPGGHSIVSFCHIARNVCRRAERLSIKVQDQFKNSDKVIQYMNRLSDYLFVLARKLSIDLYAKETPWKPRV
ncbi:MAG: cob(I)yrinic acid a,c-diamide adenosyltransferase [Bacteroidales bacterium]|nr:cob(I)yrinic acid a,c-diamide adenosyltransferase [Bacteroidales bacterium]